MSAALASSLASGDFTPFLPMILPIDRRRAAYENRFVAPEASIAVGEVASSEGAFTLMMFPVAGLKFPYLVLGRKGDVDLGRVAKGRWVQFESIDFDSRFAVRSDDPRAAVMLIDQGMMQWLLDCDRVNFQLWGGQVFAFVKHKPEKAAEPVELEVLLRFLDGFAVHVPEIVRSEFPWPQP